MGGRKERFGVRGWLTGLLVSRDFWLVVAVGLVLVLAYWWVWGWLSARYDEPESFYSHGYLIPFAAAYLLWTRRRELAAPSVRPWIAAATNAVSPLALGLCGVAGVLLLRAKAPGVLAEAPWLYGAGVLGAAFALCAVWLAWTRRGSLARAGWDPIVFWLAAFSLAGWLCLHLLGTRFLVGVVSGVTLPFVVFTLATLLFGSATQAEAFFPLAYLFFAVPLPQDTMQRIAFHMKLFATNVAATVSRALGAPIEHEASYIYFVNGGQVFDRLEVGAPCSGLSSLISMLALSIFFACVVRGKPWKRALLVVLSMPIALASNIVRLVALVFATWMWTSQTVVEGWFHDVEGYIVWVVAVALLGSLWGILTWPERSRHEAS